MQKMIHKVLGLNKHYIASMMSWKNPMRNIRDCVRQSEIK